MYDDATGNIYHSLCNSNGSTPIFPEDDTATLHLDIPPKKGTTIAGTGYVSEGRNVAAIHYLTQSGGIVQALFTCNATGHYVSDPDQAWIVSDRVNPPVSTDPNTDLSAIFLSQERGYRIFYAEENQTLAMLQSERNLTTDENQWSYGYHVSLSIERGTSHPSGFVDPDSIVVVSGMVTKGFNNGTVEVSTSREHDWRVEGFPHMYFNSTPSEDAYDPAVATEQTNNTDHMYIGADYSDPPDGPLNAFNGNVTKLGLAFDAAGNGAIFYIGQDAGLYQMQERKQDEWWKNQWFKTDRQDTSRWPFADSASSDIAVAFDADSDKIWIYYVVGGTMTQVHQSSSGVWEEAVALPKSDAPVEDPAAGEGDADGGLSGGAKAGIGVGVGVGGLVAALAAAYAFFRRRRSRRNQNDEPAVAAQEVQAMATGPVMPASPQELYVNPEVGQWQYHDLRLSQKYSSVGASPPLQVYHEMLAPGSTQWIAPNNDQVAEVPASMSPK